jgi:hypothetical protein
MARPRISPAKTAIGPRPKQPSKINASAILRDARKAATGMTQEQRKLLRPLFSEFQRFQQGSVADIAGNLRNPYTRTATQATRAALGTTDNFARTANQAQAIGQSLRQAGQRQINAAGPNALESQIYGLGQSAMGASADQVRAPRSVRELNPAQAGAARAGIVEGPESVSAERINQISRGATDVRAGGLGRTLLGDATSRLRSGGRLTPQEDRDVAQSTRASFAARGLATSAPAAMTEALNRDRYSRQRMIEDRNYAQDVQVADINRQQMNSQRQLAALQGNQNVGVQMSLADQQAANEMRRLGYTGAIDQNQFNAGNRQQANLANQSANNQIGLANQQRDQALGELFMRAQIANQGANQAQMAQNRGFMMDSANLYSQNPMARLDAGSRILGLGGSILGQSADIRNAGANVGFRGAETMLANDPYARALPLGMAMSQFGIGRAGEMTDTRLANAQDLFGNAASFNANMGQDRFNTWMNNATALRTGSQAANSALEAANISAAATRSAANRPFWEVGLNTIGSILG